MRKTNNGHKLPYLDAIAIQFIPDIQSEFMLFLQGKLRLYQLARCILQRRTPDPQLEPYSPNTKTRFKHAERSLPQHRIHRHLFGQRQPRPIQSKKIRQAINIGFDRKLMIAYLRNNVGYPAKKGMIPKGLPGTSSEEFEYDPALARTLGRGI